MKINSAEFITSAYNLRDYPPETLPEVAFAGRSNVGKSSLLNTLLSRKNLAYTSSTPGRTQAINFFRINGKILFVDLPGYGFARVPLAVKREWKPMVESYLRNRKNLVLVVLIVDSRREPTENDLNLFAWLKFHHLPVSVVATKSDKLTQHQKNQQASRISSVLNVDRREVILFSAKTGVGKEEIWKRIITLTSSPPQKARPREQ